jgi:hypothetical protein
VSKTGVIIDNMVGIVGQDLTKGTNTPVNGQPLFEREDTLYIAKKLAEKDMEESMSYTDCFADRLDRAQLNRITETVMEYLEKQYWT